MPINHPPKHQLIAFGQGKLTDDESLHVEQHLEACPACCETLFELKDDTFAGVVRIAREIKLPEEGRPNELPVALVEHPRYRVVELIGRGGMGSVYRAEHRLMNRSVAIKLVNAQLVRHPLAVERFHREVQAAAKLSHPNIVAAYDAEQAGGAHFLVMEFVNGTDLATLVQQRGPMAVAEACECIRQAAEGLQHAHKQGMVHRDIKPHNLMLSAGNQVRILDFGLAGFATESALSGCLDQDVGDPAREATKSECANPHDDGPIEAAAAHLTAIGSVIGTPDYIAPEQAVDAHSADIRADIYSLGCTLHFLLTGKPPFEADNVLLKLKAHAEQSPPELTTLRSDVPAKLSKVVARMLAKNPSERFQTPAEVADALAPFAAAAPIRPQRSWRTLVAAAALAAVVLVAGAITYVQTDKGEFVIETKDENIAVIVNAKGVKIRDQASGREYLLQAGTKDVRTGTYEIVVEELPDGIAIEGGTTFTVKRGGRAVATAKLKSMSDKERIQGVWVTESMESGDGQRDENARWEITFTGDRMRIGNAGFFINDEGEFRLHESANPRQFNWNSTEERLSWYGIYRLDGDSLTLCMEEFEKDRPTEFSSKGGSKKRSLYVLKRSSGLTPSPRLTGAMSETVTVGINGGFEVAKSGLPVGWSFYTRRTVPSGDFDIVMDTTDFKEGKQSLKFVVRKCDSTGGRLSPGFFNEFQDTKPGETYKISFWAKNAGSEFAFKARGVSATGGEPGVVIRSKETINAWRRFECTYTIPPKKWLRLELNVLQPGTFWIDDIQIVRK